ncbi:hypothetical protein F0L17_22485 [Streptomyces sp. TRM43335]|uniref:Peptide zinc metalloprotease protein n=1 Tax=Streptomyces taklimakanensis TaxID=2569853 RepID=A0A6G2BHV5_9ACTN|nr:hypothetical protein [Streptomyces taklimakanensis]
MRPRLAPHVVVHEPAEAGTPWIVQAGQKYLRVGADMGRLLEALDGERDHEGLARRLGAPWTASDVEKAVAQLQRTRLLDDGSEHRPKGTWFKYVPPMTLQFTVLKPQWLLDRMMPLIGRLATPAGAVAAAVLALGGVIALALQTPALARSLGEPLPIAILFAVTAATFATTGLHELGHGAALAYYGGRPSRMGFMLFYMTPAFFCDVSDGWRLPRREQRTRIALAGIVVQLVVGGTAAVSALVVGRAGGASTLYDAMVVFAVSTYVSGVLNLVPFVKFDGYLALMSHLDISHLRDRAMTDARRAVARVLFGGTYARELPRLPWAVPFGLVCMVFPLYLVGVAATLWADILQSLGVLGTVLVVAAVCYLLYRLGLGARRLLEEARRAGARPWRTGVVSVLIAAAVIALTAFVKVPYTVVGGFVRDGDRIELVLAETSDVDVIGKGTEVRLQRRGVVLRTDVGTGVVTDGTPRSGTAPLSAFLPVREVDDLPMPVVSFPLRAEEAPSENYGMAYVEVGSRPVGEWLFLTYVAPTWR